MVQRGRNHLYYVQPELLIANLLDSQVAKLAIDGVPLYASTTVPSEPYMSPLHSLRLVQECNHPPEGK